MSKQGKSSEVDFQHICTHANFSSFTEISQTQPSLPTMNSVKKAKSDLCTAIALIILSKKKIPRILLVVVLQTSPIFMGNQIRILNLDTNLC